MTRSDSSTQHDAGLGAVLSVHPGSRRLRNASLGIALAGGFALATLLLDLDAPQSLRQIARLGLPALGVALLFVGLVGFARLSRRRATIHTHGVSYRQGGRIEAFRHDEVVELDVALTEVHNAGGGYARGRLRVRLRDGRRISLNPNVENVGAVVGALVKGSKSSVIAAVVDQLRHGKSLECGPIQLTPAGVTHRRRTIAFADVTRVWERSKNAALGNRTKVVLSIHPEEGEPIVVPAARVLHRHHLEAIARKMAS